VDAGVRALPARPALLQAVERRIQRALLEEHLLLRRLGDPFRDRIAVARAPAQRLQDQKSQRAADEVRILFAHSCSPERRWSRNG
jgi:hypothetical protein